MPTSPTPDPRPDSSTGASGAEVSAGGRWGLVRYVIYCRECGQLGDSVSDEALDRKNPSRPARNHHRETGHDVIVFNLHTILYTGGLSAPGMYERGYKPPRLWARMLTMAAVLGARRP